MLMSLVFPNVVNNLTHFVSPVLHWVGKISVDRFDLMLNWLNHWHYLSIFKASTVMNKCGTYINDNNGGKSDTD